MLSNFRASLEDCHDGGKSENIVNCGERRGIKKVAVIPVKGNYLFCMWSDGKYLMETSPQKLIIWVWMWRYVIIYSWRWNTSHTFGVVLIMPSKAEQSLMGCQTFNRSLSESVLQLPTFAEVLQNKTSVWQQISAVPRLERTIVSNDQVWLPESKEWKNWVSHSQAGTSYRVATIVFPSPSSLLYPFCALFL